MNIILQILASNKRFSDRLFPRCTCPVVTEFHFWTHPHRSGLTPYVRMSSARRKYYTPSHGAKYGRCLVEIKELNPLMENYK